MFRVSIIKDPQEGHLSTPQMQAIIYVCMYTLARARVCVCVYVYIYIYIYIR